MLWAISRVCKPNTEKQREANLTAHREFLTSQKAILVLSGAQFDDEGKEQVVSLLIVNVNSRAEAEKFINADPFIKAGLFTDVKITRMRKGNWNPQVAEGA